MSETAPQYQDRTMTCIEKGNCLSGGTFVFTAGEQRFYDTKGLTEDPKRCKLCRDRRKAAKSAPAAEAPVGSIWQTDDTEEAPSRKRHGRRR